MCKCKIQSKKENIIDLFNDYKNGIQNILGEAITVLIEYKIEYFLIQSDITNNCNSRNIFNCKCTNCDCLVITSGENIPPNIKIDDTLILISAKY